MSFSPENAKALGRLVQSRITEKGIKNKAVMQKAGISRTYLAELKRGERYDSSHIQLARPSLDVLRRLDTVLGLGEEAYKLAGYSREEYSLEPSASSPQSVEYQWNKLFEVYVGELKQTFQSTGESNRGQMLEDISKVVKRYNLEAMVPATDPVKQISAAGFGKHLKQLRTNKGLTQAALAQLAGLDTTTISKFENDKQKPRKATLLALASCLDIDASQLLEPAGYTV